MTPRTAGIRVDAGFLRGTGCPAAEGTARPAALGSPHVQTSRCIFVRSKGRNQTRYRVFIMRKGGYGGSHDDDAGSECGSLPDVLPDLGSVALSQRRWPALACPRPSVPAQQLPASLTRYFRSVRGSTRTTRRPGVSRRKYPGHRPKRPGRDLFIFSCDLFHLLL